MAHVRIFCHADLEDLQSRSDGYLAVELHSLESVRIASDSYALLRKLIDQKSTATQVPLLGNLKDWRYWDCPQIDLLLLVAGVEQKLHVIKHDLYPLLVVHGAKLEGDFLKALLLLKNTAVALGRLAKDAKEIVERCAESLDEEEDDVPLAKLVGKVEKVGKEVKGTADLVLEGTHNIAWLQRGLPSLLEVVDALLSTLVVFPPSSSLL